MLVVVVVVVVVVVAAAAASSRRRSPGHGSTAEKSVGPRRVGHVENLLAKVMLRISSLP